MTDRIAHALRAGTLALCGALVASAGAAEYGQVVPEKSEIAFESQQMGVAVPGRFPKFTAEMSFDPARPEAGQGRIEIDLGSIDAGSPDANTEVKRKPWLDVAGFPKATFVASRFRALGGGRYEAAGKLTIKGRSQDVVAPFTFAAEGAQGRFQGTLKIKRLAFMVGEGTWSDTDTVADDVSVRFRLVANARK